MTEPIGYNDNQFDDLPNEDASWHKMSQMLDKDNSRRKVLPFWLKLSGLAILLVGLGIAGWMVLAGGDEMSANANLNEVTHGSERNKADQIPERVKQGEESATRIGTGLGDVVPAGSEGNAGVQTRTVAESDRSAVFRNGSVKDIGNSVAVSKNVVEKNAQKTIAGRKESSVRPIEISTTSAAQLPVQSPVKKKMDDADPSSVSDEVKDKKQEPDQTGIISHPVIKPVQNTGLEKTGGKETEADPNKLTLSMDTSAKSPPATNIQSDTSSRKEAVAGTGEKARKNNPLQWSLGVSFQQPVALGSQAMSEYNYRGNKSFIADHLPGIYLTAGKNKWFVAGEFSYAAPQPVEQIYFSQNTKFSVSNSNVSRERHSVEKIYHHQFLLSGNYLLLPRWSAGVGGSYQLLTGAVTEKELRQSNVITGETQTQRILAPVEGYKDSFFFRSTASAFLQSEYHWKRWKLGVRYAYALQPYMRYTRPEGEIADVRNNTLHLLLRFQLWKKSSKSP